MTAAIPAEQLAQVVIALFEETVTASGSMYLEINTSLLETLETISAEEASVPVSSSCAALSAQVEHVRFYMEVMENILLGGEDVDQDWQQIWRTVEEVTPEQWDQSRARLRATYQRLMQEIRAFPAWDQALPVPLMILVHTAFHLGQIRQSLCTLQQR